MVLSILSPPLIRSISSKCMRIACAVIVVVGNFGAISIKKNREREDEGRWGRGAEIDVEVCWKVGNLL